MTKLRSLLATIVMAAFWAFPAAAAGPASPVVVELFTSQGCSSCPPANAYLGELAKEPGVIALGFHVDYWDYIGWKDPFASAGSTSRQRRYSEQLGSRYLYTPEMVVDGKADATGSDRSAVGRLIQRAGKAGAKIAISVAEPRDDHYRITLPAGSIKGTATLWAAIFERQRDTAVERGENEGRTLRDFNAVRELRSLGHWDGTAQTIELDMDLPRAQGCVLLLQADVPAGDGQGPILGAARVEERDAKADKAKSDTE